MDGPVDDDGYSETRPVDLSDQQLRLAALGMAIELVKHCHGIGKDADTVLETAKKCLAFLKGEADHASP